MEQQIEALARKRGRPSNAASAILDARSQGETLVGATLDNWNKALEEHAEHKVMTHHVGGRPIGQVVQYLQNTNGRIPLVKSVRVEETAATKVMMCEVLKENLKNYSNPLKSIRRQWRHCIQSLGRH